MTSEQAEPPITVERVIATAREGWMLSPLFSMVLVDHVEVLEAQLQQARKGLERVERMVSLRGRKPLLLRAMEIIAEVHSLAAAALKASEPKPSPRTDPPEPTPVREEPGP